MRRSKQRQRLNPRLFELSVEQAIRRLQCDLENENTQIGASLPSVRELIKRYKITIGVIRKVIERLETCGFIEKRPRKGTFLLQKASEWRFDSAQPQNSLTFVPKSDLAGKMIGLVAYINRQHSGTIYNRAYAMYNTVDTFCHRHGAISFLFNCQPSHKVDERLIREIEMRCPDGLIFMPSSKSNPEEGLKLLRKLRIPLTMAHQETRYVDNVIVSHESMAYIATRHLIELGHRNILYQDFKTTSTWNQERYMGFERAISECSDKSLHVDTLLFPYDEIDHTRLTEEFYRDLMMKHLPEIVKQGVTGLVCSAPVIGKVVLDSAREYSIRIPEELAFVNIGDFYKYDNENMTNVRYPLEGVGALALETLIKRMQNPSAITQQLRVPGELIRRGTT